MSHAANLRKYRPPQQDTSPAKRRKLSPSASHRQNGHANLADNPIFNKQLTVTPTQDVKSQSRKSFDDRNAVVARGDNVNDVDSSGDEAADQDDEDGGFSTDLGSDEEQEDDVSQEEEEEEEGLEPEEVGSGDESSEPELPQRSIKYKERSTHAAADTNEAGEAEDEENAEPSFGDMLRAREGETVTVTVPNLAPAADKSNISGSKKNKALAVPSAHSLGTVLEQALRTDDVDLLESCLNVHNLESIRATIERIHPTHAASLLTRLAERLHQRPGRAGSLMVWVQWTIVAHGGYIASQRDAMRQMQTLYSVVKQRASGLQPLLALKGKLDMLEAQMQLRRNMERYTQTKGKQRPEKVIYVEGREVDSSEDEQEGEKPGRTDGSRRPKQNESKSSLAPAADSEASNSDSDDGEDMPTTLPNGVGDSDEEDDEDDEDDEESDGSGQDGLLDDEAEEAESGDDEEEDEEEEDEADTFAAEPDFEPLVENSSKVEDHDRPKTRSDSKKVKSSSKRNEGSSSGRK